MRHPRRFMTAQWNHLLMMNYAVDPSLLRRYVPAGTELDNFEGTTYVSRVGFEFNCSRILGLPIPFHQAFEEVNLRFYVRRSSKRGVVFIRELVPKYAVSAIARFAFNENYACVPMSHRIETSTDKNSLEAEYSWGSGLGRCSISIQTEADNFLPPAGSASEFITEHYWGYAVQKGGGCLEYEVQHDRWWVRKARRAVFSGDATQTYGATFAEVLKDAPHSAFLAQGSLVSIFTGAKIV
jgi:uncharacterized protein YqjF (DUF2071 family)